MPVPELGGELTCGAEVDTGGSSSMSMAFALSLSLAALPLLPAASLLTVELFGRNASADLCDGLLGVACESGSSSPVKSMGAPLG